MLAVIHWIIIGSDSGLPAFQDHLNLPPQAMTQKIGEEQGNHPEMEYLLEEHVNILMCVKMLTHTKHHSKYMTHNNVTVNKKKHENEL